VATQSDSANSVLLSRPLRSTPAVGPCRYGCGHERGSYLSRRRRRQADGRSRGCGLRGGRGAKLHAVDLTCGGHRRTADQRGGSQTMSLSFRGLTQKNRGLQRHLTFSKKACDCGCTSWFATAAPTCFLHVWPGSVHKSKSQMLQAISAAILR